MQADRTPARGAPSAHPGRAAPIAREPITSRLLSFLAALTLAGACIYESVGQVGSSPSEPASAALASSVHQGRSQVTVPDSVAPESEPAPEAVLAAADSAPRAEPGPPPPLSPHELAELLLAAQNQFREWGVRARPRFVPPRSLPPASGLETAYHEQRAFVLTGELDQVRAWMALAKHGVEEPDGSRSLGPLARYDLIVTRDEDDEARLHVLVPAQGLAPEGQIGRHEAWIEGERWLNLADWIEPGRHYLPYKTKGDESLHRQWGKAEVVSSLVDITAEYRQRTGVLLGIGDLSHVTGGKIKDHWTHREGTDVDLYLLDHDTPDPDGRPRIWWHHFRRNHGSIWSSQPQGKGEKEPRLDPLDELSDTPTSQRLRVLAQIVFPRDEIAYFVHDDPHVLSSFDDEVGERRPGRRFLHARNRGMWPRHCDHVHLRWVEGELPVDGTPRP